MSMLFSIFADVLSLVGFARFLTSGPITALITEPLASVWISSVLFAELLFFVGGYTILHTTQQTRMSQARLWFEQHKVPRVIFRFSLIAIGLLQSVFHLVIIFSNDIVTAQDSSHATVTIPVILVTSSAVAFALLIPGPRRLQFSQKLSRAFNRTFVRVILFSFASLLFPLFVFMIFLARPSIPSSVKPPLFLPYTLSLLLSFIVLNMLHFELSIHQGIGEVSAWFLSERIMTIFFLLYMPYRLFFWLTENRRPLLLVLWPCVYLLVQLVLIYRLV